MKFSKELQTLSGVASVIICIVGMLFAIAFFIRQCSSSYDKKYNTLCITACRNTYSNTKWSEFNIQNSFIECACYSPTETHTIRTSLP